MSEFSKVSRRTALLGGMGLLCGAGSARGSRTQRDLVTQEVAAGIHVRRGLDEDVTAANEDAIANVAYIVGRDAVAVFDPGGSLADGERLRAAIRRRTALPIRFVMMSHVHPDHIFGAGAFQRDQPQYIGHVRLAAAMAQRGDYYRQRLESILGSGRAGPLVSPTRVVNDKEELDLGNRVLLLTAHDTAHSDCDLSVIDRQTGTLLTGDLLFVKRVPALEGRLAGWLRVLSALKALPVQRAVPGHGPASVNCRREPETWNGT